MTGEPIDAELVDPIDPKPVDAPPVTAPTPDYDERGNPSLDYVRDKIESRHAVSIGMEELTDTSTVDQQFAEREQAGRDRLEQIRRSMGG